MANFGKAQLLKYGWTEGKGLGKNENGIKNPIRANFKFDTAGIGHKENDTNWWESAFNKAAKSIAVESDASGDVSIKLQRANDSSKKAVPVNSIYKNFCKTSTLSHGEIVQDNVSEDETEDPMVRDINILSDEDLLKVCGGRTAHKGARHGLKMKGKLERIAKQEQEFLASQAPSAHWKKTKTARKLEKRQIRNLSNVLSTSCSLNDTVNYQKIEKKRKEKDVDLLPKGEDTDKLESTSQRKASKKKAEKAKKGIIDMSLVEKYINFSEITDPSITNPTDNENSTSEGINRKKRCKRNRNKELRGNSSEKKVDSECSKKKKMKYNDKSNDLNVLQQLVAFSITEDVSKEVIEDGNYESTKRKLRPLTDNCKKKKARKLHSMSKKFMAISINDKREDENTVESNKEV